MPLLPGIIKSLFDCENSPIRFELVCIDLYRAAEGIELVPTSRTWDRGRDGRSISISGGNQTYSGILCATLSFDLDIKIEADIRHLAETSQTDSIVYCTSHSLSEDACYKLEAKIRKLHPTVKSVRVLGQIQLMALGERFENILRHHYLAEIQNIERALLIQPTTDHEPENIGLRLALITQTGDDARTLRSELAKRLVLENLQKAGPLNPGKLAVMISGQLHLARSISANYISEILSQLNNEGFVDFQNDKACINISGIEYVNNIPHEASSKLLEGRSAIRKAIKTLSGHSIIDDQYEKVWNSLQDGLSELFYSHGSAIVRMVASLISGESLKPQIKERMLLEQLGDRILHLFSDQTQRNEIRQAIIDMFSEKETEAFKWLTQICIVYVMMCSLGFEALSSQQVTKALSSFRLVADSDVIISLLCEGEKNHEAVKRIVLGWKALGGKLLMSTSVVEEVAYHAWISENDYNSMRDLLDHISDIDANHLIGNAFVRTFRCLSKGKTGKKYWDQYIIQYRGDTKYDYGRIMEILREEYGFDLLPDAGEEYQDFADRATQFLMFRMSKEAGCNIEAINYRLKDKCRRDGLLIAAVIAARNAARQSGIRVSTMIISSARLLKEADETFRRELGQPDAVVSTAALGCLLTLTPGVKMGMESLREVLFDLGLAARLTPMQRYAYRLIAASEQVDLPWSRRVTLQRELGTRLLMDAKSRDEPVSQITKKVLRSEDPEFSAKIVAEALDQMAVTPDIEKQLLQARMEIRKLTEELNKERHKDRTRVSKPAEKYHPKR